MWNILQEAAMFLMHEGKQSKPNQSLFISTYESLPFMIFVTMTLFPNWVFYFLRWKMFSKTVFKIFLKKYILFSNYQTYFFNFFQKNKKLFLRTVNQQALNLCWWWHGTLASSWDWQAIGMNSGSPTWSTAPFWLFVLSFNTYEPSVKGK